MAGVLRVVTVSSFKCCTLGVSLAAPRFIVCEPFVCGVECGRGFGRLKDPLAMFVLGCVVLKLGLGRRRLGEPLVVTLDALKLAKRIVGKAQPYVLGQEQVTMV